MKSVVLALFFFVVSDTWSIGQELRTEAVEAVLKTIRWAEKIKSYDLELVSQRIQSIQESETTFSTARIVREVCFDSSRFFIKETSGMWYLSLGKNGQSDSIKSMFRVGDSKSAKAWTKGFAEGAISCPAGNCIESARSLRWKLLPICFALPLEPNAEEKQLDQCVELLMNKKHSRVTSVDNMVMTHFGQKKDIRDFKIVFDLFGPANSVHSYIGIELIVSAEGDDQGYVLALKWFKIKENIEDALSKANIVNLDRSVSCKWEKRRFFADEIVVPTQVSQKYFQEEGKDTLAQTTSYNWKQKEEALKEITQKEFEDMVSDSEKRVNKLLNR